MEYLEYYGLKTEPFSNAPVSRFYFDSDQHNQALLRLKYAVHSMKGLAILVGGIGAGKTTLARRLLDSLDEKEYEAALLVIVHSSVTADWLLKRIAAQLGVEDPASDKLMLLGQLYRRLIEIYEEGRKAVVLIDEAQMLATRELMEEFRGLLNIEVPEQKLLSFVFFGLPDVELNLQFDPPLAQRVALRVRLDPFDVETTRKYVEHRMKMAGAANSPFTSGAYRVLQKATGGVARLINTVCDNALFEGAMARTRAIDADLVRRVSQNLSLGTDEAVALAAQSIPPPSAFLPGLMSEPPTLIPHQAATMSLPPSGAQEVSSIDLQEIDRVLASLQKTTPS